MTRPTDDKWPSTHLPTILMAVTVDQSLKLMWGFPEHLAGRGWNVHVASSGDSTAGQVFFTGPAGRTHFHTLPMRRRPSPWRDLLALCKWVQLIRGSAPDIVLIGTPKASLLGLTAAAIARVPCRIYLLRGLRLEGEHGAMRRVLLIVERLTASMAHRVVSVSSSLAELATASKIGGKGKNLTLRAGSSNGIRIPAESELPGTLSRSQTRLTLGLKPDLSVIGFVGRLTSDKGLDDLFGAAQILTDLGRQYQLLIVGDEDEPGYAAHLEQRARELRRPCLFTGYVAKPQELYVVMDVFVLPSRREGMPTVSLEAASYAVPVVTTTATGCADSIVNGITGYSYTAGDSDELAERLDELINDPATATKMGAAGRTWVTRWFSRDAVWQAQEDFFLNEIAQRSQRGRNGRPRGQRAVSHEDD